LWPECKTEIKLLKEDRALQCNLLI